MIGLHFIFVYLGCHQSLHPHSLAPLGHYWTSSFVDSEILAIEHFSKRLKLCLISYFGSRVCAAQKTCCGEPSFGRFAAAIVASLPAVLTLAG